MKNVDLVVDLTYNADTYVGFYVTSINMDSNKKIPLQNEQG